MHNSQGGERVILVMAQPDNGDGYVFSTADPARALAQFEEWCERFGRDQVRGNEGFERLVGDGLSPPGRDKP